MALPHQRTGRQAGHDNQSGNNDDTVKIVPAPRAWPSLRGPTLRWLTLRWLIGAASGLGLLAIAGLAAWFALTRAPLPLAGETAIFRHVGPHFTTTRFRDDPRILVIDCPDLHAQGLMFDRIAALIEKADAPHDRVLSRSAFDAMLHTDHQTIGTYYYGNDYPAAALRRFFRLAATEHLTLNRQERRLRTIIRREGFLRPGASGAVISIPQAGATHRVGLRARAVILRHELSHGAYFTLPAYHAFVHRFYNHVMTAPERAAFQAFLARQGYDAHDHGLMVNETLAYLVFTRDRRFFRASAVGLPHATVAALRKKFVAAMPPIWLRRLADAPLPHP